MDRIRSVLGALVTCLVGALVAALALLIPSDLQLLRWLLVAIVVLFTLPAAYACISFTPWIPTPRRDMDRIRSLSELKDGHVFYDLGCGDGRIVAYMGLHTRATCVGIEFSPFHYLMAKVRQLACTRSNVRIRLGDLFRQHLGDVDVVFVYACPETLKERFREKLQREMREGSKVISYKHEIEGMKPVEISRPSGHDTPIYLYAMSSSPPPTPETRAGI